MHPEIHSFLGLGRLSSKASGTVSYSLEKEALESSLFDVQRQLAQLEARREQLEADGQALLLAKETLTGTGSGLGNLQASAVDTGVWKRLGALGEACGYG